MQRSEHTQRVSVTDLCGFGVRAITPTFPVNLTVYLPFMEDFHMWDGPTILNPEGTALLKSGKNSGETDCFALWEGPFPPHPPKPAQHLSLTVHALDPSYQLLVALSC